MHFKQFSKVKKHYKNLLIINVNDSKPMLERVKMFESENSNERGVENFRNSCCEGCVMKLNLLKQKSYCRIVYNWNKVVSNLFLGIKIPSQNSLKCFLKCLPDFEIT